MEVILVESLTRSGNHLVCSWVQSLYNSCYYWQNVSPQISRGPLNDYYKTGPIESKIESGEQAWNYFNNSHSVSPQASGYALSDSLDASLLLNVECLLFSFDGILSHDDLSEINKLCEEKNIKFYHISVIRDFFNWCSDYMRYQKQINEKNQEDSYQGACYLWEKMANIWLDNNLIFSNSIRYDNFVSDYQYRNILSKSLGKKNDQIKDFEIIKKTPKDNLELNWQNIEIQNNKNPIDQNRHHQYKIFFKLNMPNKNIENLNSKIFGPNANYFSI